MIVLFTDFGLHTLKGEKATASGGLPTTIEVPRARTKASHTHALAPPDRKPDQKLLQAVVRAHAWLAELKSERLSSIEELAIKTKLHPKVVRQALRMAFLSPGLTSAILEGDQPGLSFNRYPNGCPCPGLTQCSPKRFAIAGIPLTSRLYGIEG
jgi:hypothetical protein